MILKTLLTWVQTNIAIYATKITHTHTSCKTISVNQTRNWFKLLKITMLTILIGFLRASIKQVGSNTVRLLLYSLANFTIETRLVTLTSSIIYFPNIFQGNSGNRHPSNSFVLDNSVSVINYIHNHCLFIINSSFIKNNQLSISLRSPSCHLFQLYVCMCHVILLFCNSA